MTLAAFESDNATGAERTSLIESILLVASEPVSIRTLARLAETDSRGIHEALRDLNRSFEGRGMRVELHDSHVQLITAPENAAIVREFLRLPRQARVSRPALETLAIVAYRQPVTRSEIEEVRGVAADHVVATLLGRGLIEERGRRGSPGRPTQYVTTPAFLQLFGLTAIEDLPPPSIHPESFGQTQQVLGLLEVTSHPVHDTSVSTPFVPEMTIADGS